MITAPVIAATTVQVVLLIVLVVVLVALVVLTIWGNKQQKKSEEAQAQLKAAAQPVSLLVIDKKRMKIRDAGLPKLVMDGIPKRMRGSKVPIVKAKVGPRIMTFLCEEDVYDVIPLKQEVKAMVSGIYILSVKSLRGSLDQKPVKKTFTQKLRGFISGNK